MRQLSRRERIIRAVALGYIGAVMGTAYIVGIFNLVFRSDLSVLGHHGAWHASAADVDMPY